MENQNQENRADEVATRRMLLDDFDTTQRDLHQLTEAAQDMSANKAATAAIITALIDTARWEGEILTLLGYEADICGVRCAIREYMKAADDDDRAGTDAE